ncbi:MAG: TSUP family transporter [Byssovorax sp.]
MIPILLLCAVAFVAGVIDAIAGGGGLLTVPSLMLVTATPRLALGTNKGQSVFGAFASLLSYHRAGRVHRDRALPSFVAALVGSLLGVRLVLMLKPELLRPVVLGLLVSVAIFFAIRSTRARKVDPTAPRPSFRIAHNHPVFTAAAIGLVMGTYDGFFGPGTGAFLIVLFTTVFGDDLVQATANAKVANFASNLGSVVSFAAAGAIDFRLALPMAVAQGLGGIVGARAALRGGERLIRAGVVVVTVALATRIAWQMSH